MLNLRDKKGNLNVLSAVAFGIITIAVMVGIGIVVLSRLGATDAACATVCGAAGTYSATTGLCSNATAANCGAVSGTAYTALNYASTQLGSSGLLSWLPAIIALIVGVFFLTYFMGGRKKY
jgi:hypothetical protein